jgi:D-arabinose 1-dehydrogenase-like Zn-dependent alcohol dehydrogenase
VCKGSNVAVVGLGGLGHMAIKLAKALGANVTLFSRSANKEKDLTQKYYDEKNEINIAHKKELELINETFNKKINKLESDLNKKKKLVNKD